MKINDLATAKLQRWVKHKESRLARIKEAKEALEKREETLNPGKPIEEKKQISFADKDARIMRKKGNF